MGIKSQQLAQRILTHSHTRYGRSLTGPKSSLTHRHLNPAPQSLIRDRRDLTRFLSIPIAFPLLIFFTDTALKARDTHVVQHENCAKDMVTRHNGLARHIRGSRNRVWTKGWMPSSSRSSILTAEPQSSCFVFHRIRFQDVIIIFHHSFAMACETCKDLSNERWRPKNAWVAKEELVSHVEESAVNGCAGCSIIEHGFRKFLPGAWEFGFRSGEKVTVPLSNWDRELGPLRLRMMTDDDLEWYYEATDFFTVEDAYGPQDILHIVVGLASYYLSESHVHQSNWTGPGLGNLLR